MAARRRALHHPRVQQHFKRGKEAMRDGQYEAAVSAFTTALLDSQSDPEFRLHLALALHANGQYKEALAHFDECGKFLTSSVYYDARAQTEAKLGKFTDAFRHHKRAISKDRKDPALGEYYFHRGQTFAASEQYVKARNDYNMAIKLGVTGANIHFCRGLVYRKLGSSDDLDKAVEALETAVTYNARNPAIHNNLGLTYFERGEFEHAVSCFTSAIKFAGVAVGGDLPQTVQKAFYHNNKGLALYRLGHHSLAITEFREAIALEDSDPYFYLNLGKCLLAVSRYSAAHDMFDSAIHINPSVALFYHSKGWAYQSQDKYLDAILQFELALQQEPAYVPSLYHIGLMYHATNQHAEAYDCFTKVIRLVPEDPRAYERRGMVLQDEDSHEQAMEDFNIALNLEPEYISAYYNRGNSLLYLRRYPEALDNFNKALELGDPDPLVFNCLALTKKALEQWHEAVAYFSKAVELDPERPAFLFNRAQCFVQMGLFRRAIQDLKKALVLDPKDPKLTYVRGLSYYGLSKYKKAVTDFFRALDNGIAAPVQPDCYYHIGLCFSHGAMHEQAVEYYSRAIELKPESTEYVHERAKALQLMGAEEDAVADFSTVINAQPANAHAYFRRAFALKALGDMDAAAADFQMASRLEPDNPRLKVNFHKIHAIDCIVLCPPGEEKLVSSQTFVELIGGDGQTSGLRMSGSHIRQDAQFALDERNIVRRPESVTDLH